LYIIQKKQKNEKTNPNGNLKGTKRNYSNHELSQKIPNEDSSESDNENSVQKKNEEENEKKKIH
jgi:hypothetical protein